MSNSFQRELAGKEGEMKIMRSRSIKNILKREISKSSFKTIINSPPSTLLLKEIIRVIKGR